MIGKWAVMMEILCDRQPEINRPHFSARERSGWDAEGREEIASCARRKTALEHCALKVAVLFFFLIFGIRALAQEPAPEYQIKAAFLFNFAKFVEWPAKAFPQRNSPIVIGVLGKNVFGHYLADTIRNKTVQNRHFEFKGELKSAAEATNCQILFISPTLKDDEKAIIKSLHNASILTVSETGQFLEAGGMINFIIEDNKIHFQISDEAAKRAGLKIDPKLLSLATRGH